MKQSLKPLALALLTLGLAAHAASPGATPIDAFDTPIVSDGSLGNLGTYAGTAVAAGGMLILDTSTGQVMTTGLVQGGGASALTNPFAGTQWVTQNGGPSVLVFEFLNFTLPQNLTLLVRGDKPAAIAATGDIVVNGNVQITANGGGGGNNTFGDGSAGGGGTGGGGGQQGQGRHSDPANPCCTAYASAGGGGGGGHVSTGQNGNVGRPVGVFQASGGAGGAAATDLNALEGGAGGGGGGAGNDIDGFAPGGNGGAGGGAVLFVTSGAMTIGGSGSITANGVSAPFLDQTSAGAGGGGAGGTIWFDVGGVFENDGLISARGGAGARDDWVGANPPAAYGFGGGGSGGLIYIDPTEIINDGTIDVSDGANGSANGGLVSLVAPIIGGTGQIVGQASQGAAAPEPASLALVCIGLAGLSSLRRRRAAR